MTVQGWNDGKGIAPVVAEHSVCCLHRDARGLREEEVDSETSDQEAPCIQTSHHAHTANPMDTEIRRCGDPRQVFLSDRGGQTI